MAKTVADVMKMVKDNEVKFVDFRFTDTRGKEQHVSVPLSHFNEDKFTDGHAFDGSSIAGWKGIEASDMQLMPDPNTANIDPFFEETTLFLQCDVVEPSDGKAYDRDPRSIAKRAEAYLKASGIGDTAIEALDNAIGYVIEAYRNDGSEPPASTIIYGRVPRADIESVSFIKRH